MSASLRNSGRSGRGIFQVHNNADTATAGPLVMKLQKRGQSRAGFWALRSLRSLFEAAGRPDIVLDAAGRRCWTGVTSLVTDNSVNADTEFHFPDNGVRSTLRRPICLRHTARRTGLKSTTCTRRSTAESDLVGTDSDRAEAGIVQAADPSVAFDGSHHVYLVYAESTASNGTGAVGQGQITSCRSYAFAAGGAHRCWTRRFLDEQVYSWKPAGSKTMAGRTPVVAADANPNPPTRTGIADTNTGNVYIAWSQASDGVANLGTTSDIELTSSTNGGTGFTTATKLNTAASRTAERQPQMVVSQGVAGAAGQVEVAWVDAPAAGRRQRRRLFPILLSPAAQRLLIRTSVPGYRLSFRGWQPHPEAWLHAMYTFPVLVSAIPFALAGLACRPQPPASHRARTVPRIDRLIMNRRVQHRRAAGRERELLQDDLALPCRPRPVARSTFGINEIDVVRSVERHARICCLNKRLRHRCRYRPADSAVDRVHVVDFSPVLGSECGEQIAGRLWIVRQRRRSVILRRRHAAGSRRERASPLVTTGSPGSVENNVRSSKRLQTATAATWPIPRDSVRGFLQLHRPAVRLSGPPRCCEPGETPRPVRPEFRNEAAITILLKCPEHRISKAAALPGSGLRALRAES